MPIKTYQSYHPPKSLRVRSGVHLQLFQAYTKDDAIRAASTRASRPKREGCFVTVGAERLAFFELSAQTRFVSAYQLLWQPGRLPKSLRDDKPRLIHALVKPVGSAQFVYAGRVYVLWSCQSSKASHSYVHFRLATPLTEVTGLQVGVKSPWTLRLISESTVRGKRKHYCCWKPIANKADLERHLAIADKMEDVELFLQHFFTLREVNVNMNRARRAMVAFMKEDDVDGQKCFFNYSRSSGSRRSDVTFYDCSPSGCFVPIPTPGANVVPRSQAMAAIREYFQTGKRPSGLKWGKYG